MFLGFYFIFLGGVQLFYILVVSSKEKKKVHKKVKKMNYGYLGIWWPYGLHL